MAMNLANCSDQNFYFGTSVEYTDWVETFDTSTLKDDAIVLYMELDTKVIHYNAMVDGTREWLVYGEEIADAGD
jgi:hypothetical protein